MRSFLLLFSFGISWPLLRQLLEGFHQVGDAVPLPPSNDAPLAVTLVALETSVTPSNATGSSSSVTTTTPSLPQGRGGNATNPHKHPTKSYSERNAWRQEQNMALLPACRVLIMNSYPWHSEILESVAKLLPLSALGLLNRKDCNPYRLVFDYKLRERLKTKNARKKLKRNKKWVDEYFSKHLKGTTTITTDTKSQRKVIRYIRSASLMDFGRKEHLWQKDRKKYTRKDANGLLYHSVVEATCYCEKDSGVFIREEKAWLAKWMLQATKHQARTCIFHETCPAKYHTPQSIWVSPHFDNYFIPWALPLAKTNETPDTITPTTTADSNSPVICSIGNPARRNFDYVGAYLNHTNSSTQGPVRFRSLGEGEFPRTEQNLQLVDHWQNISDDLEFARMITEGCDALMLLMNPVTHPDYFMGPSSKCKLSGSIPPILAYRLPYLIHEDMLDLYSKDLLPLNLPHATFTTNLTSFVSAVSKLVQEMMKDQSKSL